MKFTPNFEMRRRISDRDRRHLWMILTLAWLVLTLTVITIILLIDYRRFESSFQDLSLNIKTNLISKIKENEAVLEGFSAYISGYGLV